MKWWGKFKSDFNTGLSVELAKLFAFYLVIDGGYNFILRGFLNYLSIPENKWYIWSAIMIVVIYFVIKVYKKINKNIPYLPNVKFDFQVLELKIVHCVKTKDKRNHKRKYKLKAKRDGLSSYRGRFLWTGGKAKIKSGDNRHSVHPSRSIDGKSTFIVDFDRSYKKGDIIDVIVEWDLEGKGSPFVSFKIQEPINKLILSVKFDDKLKIKDSEFQETYALFSNVIPKNHSNLIPQNNCISKVINAPKLLHLYELRWKW